MTVPTSTYRLQLGGELGFRAAAGLAAYLAELGCSHVYLSPVTASRRGSEHGYDVVDPRRLDAELGGEEGFAALEAAVREAGLGLVLDVVPNHMAAVEENPFWRDVLEHGPSSPYAAFFDIDWAAGGERLAEASGIPPEVRAARGPRLLLPVLGEPLEEAIGAGHLRVAVDPDGLVLLYRDARRLPLEPRSWLEVLGAADAGAGAGDPGVDAGANAETLDGLRRTLEGLPSFTETDPDRVGVRRSLVDAARRELARLREEELLPGLEARAAAFGPEGGEQGRTRLTALVAAQPWTPVHWRTADEGINYRRFFEINELAAVRAERPEVFDETHALPLRLVREGRADGLRIDHVDGLWDPRRYLERLRERAAPAEPWIVVEKILAPGEELPEGWPVAGTTGYDFLGVLQGLFVHRPGLERLDRTYRRATGREERFAAIARERKRRVLREQFGGEVRFLARELVGFAGAGDVRGEAPSEDAVAEALIEVTACLPVYRTYVRDLEPGEVDRRRIEAAVGDARERAGPEPEALEAVRRVLLLEEPDPDSAAAWLRTVLRWQQLSGPATAKGVEDTALYVHNRLAALNEVGSEPDEVADAAAVHAFLARRAERWPASMNAASTHDTKRSEDVRARLLTLTDLAEAWEEAVGRWRGWNAPLRGSGPDGEVPAPDDELLLYQTLLGAWPLDPEEEPDFLERMSGFLRKNAREAKERSDWRAPDQGYEEGTIAFAAAILDGDRDVPFREEFLALQERVAFFGALNSLAQTAVALLAPGVPDRYRGTELWDFSLVDPDNRRPVDWDRRRRLLRDLRERAAGGRGADEREALCEEAARAWRDGRVKLLLLAEGLAWRRRNPELVSRADYLPLDVRGELADHAFGFARRLASPGGPGAGGERGQGGDRWAAVVVPRGLGRVGVAEALPLPAEVWGETAAALPEGAPDRWRDVLTGREVGARAGEGGPTGFGPELRLADLLEPLPVSLLETT